MKPDIQFTPEMKAALICTLLWFALWTLAFQPEPVREMLPPVETNAGLRTADARDIPRFSSPTLFALPSRQGFSDTFPEDRVNMTLQFESPDQPSYELPPGSFREGDPNPAPLYEAVAFPRTEEHLPGSFQIRPAIQPGRVEYFFPPNLKNRLINQPDRNPPGELPESVRVRLKVNADGIVERVFFETPTQNQNLIAALMGLRFAPASEAAEGWVELRSKGGNS